MKRSMIAVLSVALLLLVGAVAQASLNLSWQTAPILGTDKTLVNEFGDLTGHVTMITGPTPIDPSTSLPYLDEGGNTVLGPTIPHYSMVGDSLFGVGSPGMTVFDWTGRVANGSGINLDAGHTYDWTAVYTNLGTGYIDSSANVYTGGSFIMLNGYLWGYGSNSSTLSVADIGSWTYVETWTDRAGGEGSFISSTTNFSIVPEPASVLVWCLLGAGSWLGMRVWRRRRVPVGRQSWSPENRQAIHDIITR